MSNDFIWTDELVNKYIRWGGFSPYNPISDMEQFKHEQSPKKEWEIVSVTEGFGSYVDVDKDGKVRYAHFSDCSVEDALKNRGYKIRSVRRLSDNEVFTVGVEFYDNASPHLKRGVISGFYIISNQTNLQSDVVCAISDECNIGKMAVIEYGHYLPKHLLNDIRKTSKPKKERIEVEFLDWKCEGPMGWDRFFRATKEVSNKKLPQLKAAIERVLNDDGKTSWGYSNDIPDEEKLYSMDYFLKEVEKAFNAAREPYCETAMGQRPKYWTFQDYVNHQRDKK